MSQYTRVSTNEDDHEEDANHESSSLTHHSDDEPSSPSPHLITIPSPTPSPSSSSSLTLTLIRMGDANRSVTVSPSQSIAELKQSAYPTEWREGKLIRLIYLGRVLSDDQTIGSLGIEEGHCLHAHITDKTTPTPSPFVPSYQQQHAPSSSSSPPSPTSPSSPTSPTLEFIHTAEGQALPVSSLYSFPPPEEGTARDLMFGYLLGLVLGFLACLWLWNSAAPRKQRVGILLGVMTNVLIGGMSGGVREAARERESAGGGGGGGAGTTP